MTGIIGLSIQEANLAYTLEEIKQLKLPYTPEIISGGLLPQGHIMFLYGEQETFKSWLAMDLCFAVATGRRWLSYSTQPVRTLIINPEISKFQYHRRVMNMAKNRPTLMNNELLRVHTALDLRIDTMGGRGQLAELCKSYKPALIVIDGLEFVCAGDVSTGYVAGELRTTIDYIRAEHNASFFFIHHKKKGIYGDQGQRVTVGVDEMYGHSIIKNIADTIFEVKKNVRDEDLISVSAMKIRMTTGSKPRPRMYKWERPTLSFAPMVLASQKITNLPKSGDEPEDREQEEDSNAL